MAVIEDFDWVTPEDRDTLSGSDSAWGDEWPEHLGRYLDERWPGWPDAGDDERREWLGARVEALALGWVSGAQQGRLAGIAEGRGDWRTWLPAQLDQWWPDWATSTPPELTGWLDETLAPQSDLRALDWVTEDQGAFLASLTDARGDWHDWLPAQLDEWWPEWAESTPDELVPWLDEALVSLVPAENAEGTEGTEAADVADFGWLSQEHRTQLDELYEFRGDWAQWLPEELDARWAEWRQSTPSDLGPWLDGILPGLVLPGEAGQILDQIAGPALAALYADLDEMAAELGMSPDELAAEIEAVPSEYFSRIVLEEVTAN